MPKVPKKYTERLTIRLTKDTNRALADRSKVMGVAPAVVGRIIIEHSLSGKPIVQETKS